MRNITTDNIKYRLRISTKRQRAQTTKYQLRPTSKPIGYFRVPSFNAVKSRCVQNTHQTQEIITVNEIPQEIVTVNEIQYHRQTAFKRLAIQTSRLNQTPAYGRPTLPRTDIFEEFDI